MPKPRTNGSGEAYQSWKSEQPTATQKMSWPTGPPTLRPPVSASATICCSSSGGLTGSALIFRLPKRKGAGLAARPWMSSRTPLLRQRSGIQSHLFDPALLLVVLRGAVVQRGGEAVLHHVLGLEVGERGMQLLELLEVVEHGFHHRVDAFGRDLGRRDQRREHAVGLRRLRIAGVEARGDRGRCVVGLLLHQLVHSRPGDRQELRAARGGRVLDVGGGVTHAVEEAIDLAVAERRAVLVGLELGCKREVAELPSQGGDQLFQRGTRARAG